MANQTVTVGSKEIPIVRPRSDVSLTSRQPGGKHYKRPVVASTNWMKFSVMSMRKRTVEPVHFISPVIAIDRSSEGWMQYGGQKAQTSPLPTPVEYLAVAGWLSSQVYADVIPVEELGTYNFFATNDFMSSALNPLRQTELAKPSNYLFGMNSPFMGGQIASRQIRINQPETFLEYS